MKYIIEKLEKSKWEEVLPTLEKIANESEYTHLSAAEIKKSLHRIFVAKFNDEIVGFGGITCYHGFWGLRLCVVTKKHRGNGLQRLLIKQRIEHVKKEAKNASRVNVWVGLKNVYSYANLVKEGFKPTGEKKSYHGIECMKLRKILA
jgi:GNAT superfamily N-acetyltransferase